MNIVQIIPLEMKRNIMEYLEVVLSLPARNYRRIVESTFTSYN